MTPSDFSHSDKNGVVSYNRTPVIILTNRGWYPLEGHPDEVYRQAKATVWSMPDSATAGEMRMDLVSRLFDD